MTKAVGGEHAEADGLMAERLADRPMDRRSRCGTAIEWASVSIIAVSRYGNKLLGVYMNLYSPTSGDRKTAKRT